MPSTLVRNNFTSGRLSPYLDCRQDLVQYQAGCRQLTNFNILPYGGIERRKGLGYVAAVKDSSKPVRIIPFEFDINTTYLIEFGHEYMRFYSDDVLVAEITTTVDTENDDIFDWSYTQINDVMYFVHPNYPPHKLSRLSQSNWTFEKIKFSYPPTANLNSDYNNKATISLTGTTGSITMTKDTFSADDIGRQFVVDAEYQAQSTIVALDAGNRYSPAINVFRTANVQTTGTWSGTMKIERSLDGGASWEDILVIQSQSDRNIQTTLDMGVDATDTPFRTILLRFEINNTAHTGAPRGYLWTDSYDAPTVFTIYNTGSAKIANVYLDDGVANTVPTYNFRKDAFSDEKGYPATVTTHEQRLVFGGSKDNPQTIYMSQQDDLENFELGSEDTDAIQFTIAAQDKNKITYLQSAKILVAGTLGGEYTVKGGNGENTNITPTTVNIKRHSNFGSSNIQGILYDDKVLYVQRQKNKLREMSYAFETDGYVSKDLSLLSEDIVYDGIKSNALQTSDYNVLYNVLENGDIAAMTYEAEQQARGWSLITTSGSFKDVAVLRANTSAGNNDFVYVLTERHNSGSAETFIERFNKKKLPNVTESTFLDGYRVYSGSATNYITGINNLIGHDVVVYDNLSGSYTTASVLETSPGSGTGSINLDYSASYVTIGLPYTSVMEIMPIDAQISDQTRRDKRNSIPKINFELRNTGYLQASSNNELDFYDVIQQTGSFYNGNKEIYVKNKLLKDVTVIAKSDLPYPTTILCANIDFAAYNS